MRDNYFCFPLDLPMIGDTIVLHLLGRSDMTTVTRFRLPRLGEVERVSAHGKVLIVKRNHTDGEWHCFIEHERRTRFGNASQIREDVAYFTEYGCLPPMSPRCWC